jgi:acyl-homoserine lactone acylase PvdQ
LVILLSRDVGWSLAGRFFVVYGETKETTWPVAATERTNVLFVFFF